MKNWQRYVKKRTRLDVRLSQCKLWAEERECLASTRSYPPLGPPYPQASPPCPRSQGHNPQVKSALFVFCFSGHRASRSPLGVIVSCLRFAQGGLRPQGENLNSGGYREARRALFQGEGPQQRGHLPVGETGGLPDG